VARASPDPVLAKHRVASMLGSVSLDVEIGQCLPVPEAQAPTGEMAVTPPSIRKSAPTTYAESSDAR
jgi:hypothetical protein